ncbi:hypothetical protein SAMN05216406_12346 [Nitrosomonas ureae]|uniref:Uncharacterized protein n=2 Tax=Nitrosomonas ureae TaxID=44577 RepID=A0A1H2FQF0_9PROT|nr:hypothetical protein SAMN05216406_12346 [Nitrosomonas ureae]
MQGKVTTQFVSKWFRLRKERSMKKPIIIILLILQPPLLVGCVHSIFHSNPKDGEKSAFIRALEEDTSQCRQSIEKTTLPNTRDKIFWISGLSEPTLAMQTDTSYIQEKEKSEIAKLYQLVDFCQSIYRRTVTSFINDEYGEYFKNHLLSKHKNLNDLNGGMITYGAYNRTEVELSKQLITDLRLLNEKYPAQARQPPTQYNLTYQNPFTTQRVTSRFMQFLFLDLILYLPILIL